MSLSFAMVYVCHLHLLKKHGASLTARNQIYFNSEILFTFIGKYIKNTEVVIIRKCK